MVSGAKPSRQEEAARWFAAQRAGVMLVEDREAFDLWRADPRNQAALDAMHELWGELAVLKDGRAAPVRREQSWRRYAGAAAAVAVAAVFASFVWLWSRDPTLETIAGQQKSQGLPDGSLVTLNVASQLSYSIGPASRVINLVDGEAAFSVMADPNRPFVVRAGDFEIRAIGTSFNVRQRNGLVEVAVSEGKVQICRASGGAAVATLASLEAGQLLRFPAVFAGEDFPAAPERIAPEQVSEWRMRVVTYEDATVGAVVEDMNRYFVHKLLVDPDVQHRRVTVRLQVEDRDRAIETLAGLLGVQLRETGTGEMLTDTP